MDHTRKLVGGSSRFGPAKCPDLGYILDFYPHRPTFDPRIRRTFDVRPILLTKGFGMFVFMAATERGFGSMPTLPIANLKFGLH